MPLTDRQPPLPAGSTPQGSPIGRRTFLSGIGVAGAALLTGCSVFGGEQETTTSTVFAPPPVDPIETLIATSRLHLAKLDAVLAAVAADPETTALLTPLRADRAAHVDALIAERGRTDGDNSSGSADQTGTVSLPAGLGIDAVSVKNYVRGDAEIAQGQFTDGVSATGKYRAAIFASISACLATHRSVLL